MVFDRTVCELFAGVGGFHKGLSNSNQGWKVVWANQWEPGKKAQHAYDCYVKNFPEVETLNIDIAEINTNSDKYPIPKHNLLVGGFPCQDYSVAATSAQGIKGKKGVLWWEIRSVLDRNKPPFVLLENVDRLLKSPAKQRGRDFGVMLGCFRDLGYSVEWRVINAAEYGCAQRRRRVFIFAFHNSTSYYKRQKDKFNLCVPNNYIQDYGFFSSNFPIKEIMEREQIILKDSILDISDKGEFNFYNSGIMINDSVITEKYVPIEIEPQMLGSLLEANVDDKYYLGEDLTKWEYMKGAKAEPRATKDGYEYMFREGAIAFPDPIDKPARTMLTSESSKNRSTHVIEDQHTKKLRLLTPRECERLNGFDDDWTLGMPEKFRYFCMGNALVVDLIEKMGKSLSDIFEKEEISNTNNKFVEKI